MSWRIRAFLFSLIVLTAATSCAAELSLRRIFEKPYLAGTRPSVADLSPDGSQLLFFWDSSAGNQMRLWSVRTTGSAARQVRDSAVASCVWSPDGKRVAFVERGDIFLADPSFANVLRLTRTPAAEGQLTWSPDGQHLGAVTNNILVFGTRSPAFTQLTQNQSADISYRLVEFSPDNRRVLFAEYDRDGLPEFLIPRFTGKHVSAPVTKRGFPKVRVGIASLERDSIVWLKTPGERFLLRSVRFSPDGTRILCEQFSTNRKHRAMYVGDAKTGESRLVYTEYDEKWIEEGNVDARWSHDGTSIFFTSERDGWNHLYVLRNDSSDLRQLTTGSWEVQWFDVHPDGGSLYLAANKDDHAQQQLFSLRVATGELRTLTSRIGTYGSPRMSRSGRVLVSSYSDFTSPSELWALREGKEVRLTSSIPGAFRAIDWIVPEIVRFPARDGTILSAMLYLPEDLNPAKSYPCVVFVHGAGYLQNVFRGWSSYYREYMFHTYLVRKGYVVFEVDYRGSAGYGRDFRTDVYMHLGGLDLQDELDGVEYLKRLGYIDSTRIGIYGGSYGGFLPLMALFTSPGAYACAAVLRAVTSWENYYHHNPWYTQARLGTPAENPEAYARSSPISFADSLQKPLLILHGMVDDNVFFQDAVQLVDTLIAGGKDFDMMIYPREGHAFQEPASWFDEYRRIDDFFHRHLQPGTP